MKGNKTSIGVIVLAASVVLLWSGTAAAGFRFLFGAAADPVVTCQTAKVKAAAKRASCLAKEQIKALKGKPSDSASCETKFDEAIAKADEKAAKKGAACKFLVDNAKGVITNLDTLDMWEIKRDDGSVHDVGNTYTWNVAFPGTEPNGTVFTEFLAQLNNCVSDDPRTVSSGFAGYCDWVLPDHVRLQTILLEPFPCGTSPCVDPVFDNGMDSFTAASFYWASASRASFPAGAWLVVFDDGDVVVGGKGIGVFVRAVRGGR